MAHSSGGRKIGRMNVTVDGDVRSVGDEERGGAEQGHHDRPGEVESVTDADHEHGRNQDDDNNGEVKTLVRCCSFRAARVSRLRLSTLPEGLIPLFGYGGSAPFIVVLFTSEPNALCGI